MKARVILADPPWSFNDRRETRRDNPARAPKFGTGVQRRYSAGTMSLSDLCDLGPLVQAVSTPDAYLFLWVSEAQPYAHLELCEAWGFRLVNCAFHWHKINLRSRTPHFGTGKYTAGNLERCLLARNGKAGSKSPCWHSTAAGAYKPAQAIALPHPRGEDGKIIHSRKPATIHEEIGKWLDPFLDGHGKLELFATAKTEGWTCLGHAISGTDIRDDLIDLAIDCAPAKQVGQRGLFDEDESA